MKVLFLSHQAEYIYGGEVVTLEFMRELRSRGVDVHFASPPGPYLERARDVAHRCHRISSRQFSRQLAQLLGIASSFWRTRGELTQLIQQEGISLVHATSLKAMAYAAVLSSPVPLIWHHHDILPAGTVNSLWLKALGARAARVLVPSGATKAALIEAGLPEEKVAVLRNGFRIEEWAQRPPQKPDHLFRIGIVGEISSRKGTDRLEGLLRELGPDPLLQVLVIGEGLSEPEFAEELRGKLASRTVRFLGRRSRMKELYHEMDLLFVPSRQDPLPTVIVEAGLSGVPVIGSRVGGIPEMIEEGRNGSLFSSEAEAAAAVRTIRANWPHFSAGAREVALRRYDIRNLTADLIAHYREVAGAV